MKEFYYTFAVDKTEKCSLFYKRNFHWDVNAYNEHYCRIETDSPIIFYLVDRSYLLNRLKIEEDKLPTQSFVTWEYDALDELLKDKAGFLKNGMREIGEIGHFLIGPDEVIWELKVKGEVL